MHHRSRELSGQQITTKSVLILFVSYGLIFRRPATVPRHRFVAAMHRAHFTMTTTAAAAKAVPKFRYLSAWFCPFAHRATLALEHHADRVDYEWVEVRIVLTPYVSTFRLTYLELLTQLLIHRHWDGSSEKMRIM